MSDDEGPRGKGKGKKGKGGGGGKDKGGKGGKPSGGGINVSRLQVLPKFLQEIQAKYRPSDVAMQNLRSRGLSPQAGSQ